jgi:hypothetical protein
LRLTHVRLISVWMGTVSLIIEMNTWDLQAWTWRKRSKTQAPRRPYLPCEVNEEYGLCALSFCQRMESCDHRIPVILSSTTGQWKEIEWLRSAWKFHPLLFYFIFIKFYLSCNLKVEDNICLPWCYKTTANTWTAMCPI